MIRSRASSVAAWVTATVVVSLFVNVQARAQEPRIRTLTFDTERKEWVEKPPPSPGTSEGDLHAINVLIKEGEYRKALSAKKRFVKKYGAGDPQYPSSLLAEAEALIGQKRYEKAYLVLESFLAEFSGTPLTAEALRLEFEVAEAFLAGAKRRVWFVFRMSGVDLAFRILDGISSDHPESQLAELALKVKADYQFKVGEHSLAELEYSRLIREYPQSRYHKLALGRAAEAALASFAGVPFDAAALIEAQERYNDYRALYPAAAQREGVDSILETIREMRAEKEFEIGGYYERTDHTSSAVYYYEAVRREYPETLAASKATSRLELLGALEPGISSVAPPDAEGR